MFLCYEKSVHCLTGHIVKLKALGFTESDCATALDKCNGQLDDAALWLTHNASPVHETLSNKNASSSSDAYSVIEVCIVIQIEMSPFVLTFWRTAIYFNSISNLGMYL